MQERETSQQIQSPQQAEQQCVLEIDTTFHILIKKLSSSLVFFKDSFYKLSSNKARWRKIKKIASQMKKDPGKIKTTIADTYMSSWA